LFSQLTLTEIKKADRHGCIYEAKQTTDEVLYEVRVYSFDRKDPSEKQYVRRNCREWKKRRRFMFSHQENGLVFFILRHPQTTTGSLSLSSLGDGFPPNAANADVFTATRHPLPSLEVSRQPRSSDDSFTSQSLSQTPASSKDNPWSWDSSWKWMYPVGWSRKLLINDEGVPRNGLFLQDFEGGFFNETVPRRIFSPEHLIHPDERDSRGYLRTDTLREQTRNYNPGK
jgi:hypothetical protein